MENQNIKDNEVFQIYGILKVGSIHIKKGSLETKFTLTDFKHEVDVFYNGNNID